MIDRRDPLRSGAPNDRHRAPGPECGAIRSLGQQHRSCPYSTTRRSSARRASTLAVAPGPPANAPPRGTRRLATPSSTDGSAALKRPVQVDAKMESDSRPRRPSQCCSTPNSEERRLPSAHEHRGKCWVQPSSVRRRRGRHAARRSGGRHRGRVLVNSFLFNNNLNVTWAFFAGIFLAGTPGGIKRHVLHA